MATRRDQSTLRRLHGRWIHARRVKVLAKHIASLLPELGSVLDVGAGDGRLAAELLELRPQLQIRGIDVVLRSAPQIRVEPFDGRRIPVADNGVDVVVLVDVLHHAEDPMLLLQESRRVARAAVIIKDHIAEHALDRGILRVMDWAGNVGQNVPMPYNYWSSTQWNDALKGLGLLADLRIDRLDLYPRALGWLFERSLHFIVRLRRS